MGTAARFRRNRSVRWYMHGIEWGVVSCWRLAFTIDGRECRHWKECDMGFSTKKQIAGLVFWLGVTCVAAVMGSMASIQAGSFYIGLEQPSWAPPGSVFGPVWTVLYLLMGIAAWLVWRERGFAGARTALVLFLVQLVLNALWSWLFFAWKMGGPAFADIIVLWALIVAMLIGFWRIKPLAGALLLPYLAWVSFASVLNYTVWQLNPQVLG